MQKLKICYYLESSRQELVKRHNLKNKILLQAKITGILEKKN
jgi:hypothetical protein